MNNLATNTTGEVDDSMAKAHRTIVLEQGCDIEVSLQVVPSNPTSPHRFSLQDGFSFVQTRFFSQETVL